MREPLVEVAVQKRDRIDHVQRDRRDPQAEDAGHEHDFDPRAELALAVLEMQLD